MVLAWGYFLYQGVRDPLGGINSLWPLFGIANQLLAAIALCVATTILIKMHGAKYMWITCVPLVVAGGGVRSPPAGRRSFRRCRRIGFLAQADKLEAALQSGAITGEHRRPDPHPDLQRAPGRGAVRRCSWCWWRRSSSIRSAIWAGILRGTRTAAVSETPFVLSTLRAEEV